MGVQGITVKISENIVRPPSVVSSILVLFFFEQIFKRIKQTFKTDGHEMKERPSNNRESGVEEPDQNRNNKHDTNVSSPEKDSYYHRIDNMSKLGFPLAYVLFNAIYFGYYRSVTKS